MKSACALAAAFALVGAVLLSACGGSSSTATTAATTTTSAATTSAAVAASPHATVSSSPTIATSSPVAKSTPSSTATASAASTATATKAVSSTATPVAQATSSSTSSSTTGTTGAQVSGPVDLATAFSNLQSKSSYQMTIDLQNVPGALSMMAGISPSPTLTVEVSNSDRHVVVNNDTGGKLAELWYVNGTAWASVAGSSPTQLSGTGAEAALLPLATADQQMIQTLSAPGANWQVTGTETVNGVPAQVETATYQINPSTNAFLGSGPYTVNGKIWVAQTGGYLVQAQMQLGQGAATPTAGGSAVSIKVSKIGEPITITAPGS